MWPSDDDIVWVEVAKIANRLLEVLLSMDSSSAVPFMEVCETTLEVLEMENPDIVACGFGEGRGGDIQPSFLEAIRGSFTQ